MTERLFTFVPDSNTSALPVNPALRNQPVEDHLAKSAPMQVYIAMHSEDSRTGLALISEACMACNTSASRGHSSY
jgi:hypothetical protein